MPSSVAVADPGAECEHRSSGRLDLVRVREVLEDLGDRCQQHRDRVAPLVGLEHRRTAEADVVGEDLLEGGEVLALGRGTESVALHAEHAIPFRRLHACDGRRSMIRVEHTARGYPRSDERDRCQGTRRRVRLALPGHALRRDPRRLVRRAGGDGRRDPVPRKRHARAQRPARAARGGRASLRALRRRQPDQRPEQGADRSPAESSSTRTASTCRSTSATATGTRSSTDTLREMAGDGVERALAFFTSAYSSYSGCRQYREDIFNAQQAVGPGAPEVVKTRMFFNHPGWIEANADHVRTALDQLVARAGCPPRLHGPLDPGRRWRRRAATRTSCASRRVSWRRPWE